MTQNRNTKSAYSIAKQRYAEYGVDTDRALEKLAEIAISLHCWQAGKKSDFFGLFAKKDRIIMLLIR